MSVPIIFSHYEWGKCRTISQREFLLKFWVAWSCRRIVEHFWYWIWCHMWWQQQQFSFWAGNTWWDTTFILWPSTQDSLPGGFWSFTYKTFKKTKRKKEIKIHGLHYVYARPSQIIFKDSWNICYKFNNNKTMEDGVFPYIKMFINFFLLNWRRSHGITVLIL